MLEKGITGMRSFVSEPMQHGRLFLAGDAAHIVPPTGAKGLNLAVADVALLAEALDASGTAPATTRGLSGYSAGCLRARLARRALLLLDDLDAARLGDDPFEQRLQLSQLRYVVSSEAAARSLAENYVGIAASKIPAGERNGSTGATGRIAFPS